MRTLGVDLASLAANTAACQINWIEGFAEIEGIYTNVDDLWIEQKLTAAEKVGIDVPLGWPSDFVNAVANYHHGRGWPGGTLHNLRFRATDLYIQDQVKRWPLSVSTDRIAVPTFRAAALLDRVLPDGGRSGEGLVVEVYPAAALIRWGFNPRGYKRSAGADNRRVLIESLRLETQGWLHGPDEAWRRCLASDDSLDALIAALVARAAALNRCDAIPPQQAESASMEGWIALPEADGLHRLAVG